MEVFRYHAFIILETETPLSVGSGEKGINVDRLIVKDCNSLPYIPGTGLAGALRAEFAGYATDVRKVDDLFGFQQGDEGQGSRLLISSAHLVDHTGNGILEGLATIDTEHSYYSLFDKLPDRDHVRITDKGGADTEGHGKYNEELLHKGVRMAFRMELISNQAADDDWHQLLDILHLPTFRIGGGSRKGYGKLRIVECYVRQFDLQQRSSLLDYLALDNSLSIDRAHWKGYQPAASPAANPWKSYTLNLQARDFFLFGASHGDEDADLIPKTETYIDWSQNEPRLVEQKQLLIPATSIKGALSHRTAYHYNRLTNTYIDKSHDDTPQPKLDIPGLLALLDASQITDVALPAAGESKEAIEQQIQQLEKRQQALEERQQQLRQLIQRAEAFTLQSDRDADRLWQLFQGELKTYTDQLSSGNPVNDKNPAVRALFGYANDGNESGQRGQVLIADVYLPWEEAQDSKVFNHVSIDRYTGGNMDGMLFSQKLARKRDRFSLSIHVHQQALADDRIRQAFEAALHDLCEGRLALGGSGTKGHGIFEGNLNN